MRHPQGQPPPTIIAHAEYKGPLPPPAALREYDAVLPGAPERIMKMAESQVATRLKLESDDATHRHAVEKFDVESAHRLASRGQWMAFTVVMAGMIGGFILIAVGRSGEGIAAVLASVGTPAAVMFCLKRLSRPKA
jgi:uncharacterized membrane protein